MSELHEAMNKYADQLLDKYNDSEEMLKELSSFYLAMIATYGVASFEVEIGATTIKVEGVVQIMEEAEELAAEDKPKLELVH